MYRKKYAMVASVAMLSLLAFSGCSKENTNNPVTDAPSLEDSNGTMNGENNTTNNGVTNNNATNNDTTNKENEIISEVPMVTLPSGITAVKAETKEYPELAKLIMQTCEIPQGDLATTRYLYNYVDLNGDGNDEIFVLVMGPYTSGTGGSTALWVEKNNGSLQVKQEFSIVNTPVIISDTMTNGMHELIVPYTGGGATSSYSILKYGEKGYNRVSDGKQIETLDGINGKAILANDLSTEVDQGMNSGIYLEGNTNVK